MKILTTIAALLVTLVGIIVLIGWYIHEPVVVQLHPSFVPMQFNTALGFALTGVAILSLLLRLRWLSVATAALATLIGALTLLEYVFDVSFGIDELLMKHDITVESSHPGRMAPNTALCFLLTGAAIIWLPGQQGKSRAATAIVSAIVFSLALVAVLGYLVHLPTAYGWGQLTRMALHTGVSFMLASVGLIAWCWQQSGSRLPKWSPALVAIAAISTSIVAWQSLVSQQDVRRLAQASGFHLALEHRLSELSLALERMARRQDDLDNPVGDKDWLEDAAVYRNHYPAIDGLSIVSESEEVISTSPPEHQPDGFATIVSRLNHGQPTSAGPVDPDGRFRIVSSFRHGEDGKAAIVATCNFKTILESTPGLPDSFSAELANPIASEQHANLSNEIHTTVNLDDTEYALHLRPLGGISRDRLAISSVLLAGMAVALLLYWLMASRLKIQDINSKLTGALDETQSANDQLEQKHETLNATMKTVQAYSQSLDRSNHELAQFAYVASHDLQSPLRGLANLTRFIDEDLKEAGQALPAGVQDHVDKLSAQVSRMQGLLTGLLEYSRAGREKHVPATLDLNSVVNDAIAMADVPATFVVSKNIRCNDLHAPKTALQRILQNLIDNAVKHHPRDDGQIQIDIDEQDDNVVFRISDDGAGIPQQSRERVFNIFQTLQPAQGTGNFGMGLAIVRKLVIDHGGQITIDDSKIGGTTFRIEWPKQSKLKLETPEF